jgi:hypothetical protein
MKSRPLESPVIACHISPSYPKVASRFAVLTCRTDIRSPESWGVHQPHGFDVSDFAYHVAQAGRVGFQHAVMEGSLQDLRQMDAFSVQFPDQRPVMPGPAPVSEHAENDD